MAPSGRQAISWIFCRSRSSVHGTVLERGSCFSTYWLSKRRLTWSKPKPGCVRSWSPVQALINASFQKVLTPSWPTRTFTCNFSDQSSRQASHPPHKHLLLCRRAFSGHRGMP